VTIFDSQKRKKLLMGSVRRSQMNAFARLQSIFMPTNHKCIEILAFTEIIHKQGWFVVLPEQLPVKLTFFR